MEFQTSRYGGSCFWTVFEVFDLCESDSYAIRVPRAVSRVQKPSFRGIEKFHFRKSGQGKFRYNVLDRDHTAKPVD